MYSAYLPSAKAFWVTMMCGSPPLVSLSNSGIHRPLSVPPTAGIRKDRKSTRLNSSHLVISYAVFCLKKKKIRHAILFQWCGLVSFVVGDRESISLRGRFRQNRWREYEWQRAGRCGRTSDVCLYIGT